jgi:hypothetical protein
VGGMRAKVVRITSIRSNSGEMRHCTEQWTGSPCHFQTFNQLGYKHMQGTFVSYLILFLNNLLQIQRGEVSSTK